MTTDCYHCHAPASVTVAVQDKSFEFCAPCVQRRQRRNGWLCSGALFLLWLPLLPLAFAVLNNTELSGYWQSARLIPPVLIALYGTAFVAFGVRNAIHPNGLGLTAEHWAKQLNVKYPISRD